MRAVQEAKAPPSAKDDHIDELESAPDWADKTLAAHARDPKPVL
jgi:hypothetical protein